VTDAHYHAAGNGIFVRCFHTSRALLTNWQFWAGLTLGFPLEHALWERVWPLSLVTKWLGF
jgi:hypothetical protein